MHKYFIPFLSMLLLSCNQEKSLTADSERTMSTEECQVMLDKLAPGAMNLQSASIPVVVECGEDVKEDE